MELPVTVLTFVTRLTFPARMRSVMQMLLAAVILLLASGAQAQLLDQKIHRPTEAQTYLLWATQDLADYLQQMTGQPFEIDDAGDVSALQGGIVLAHVNQAGVPQDIRDGLKNKSANSFHIRMVEAAGDKPAQLWIVGNDLQLGLCHGIYFYLEQLGMRFYYPGKHWTIVPQRSDIALAIDKLVKPDYETFGFFGTGGFGPGSEIDPENEMKDRWMDWKRRLRGQGPLQGPGHVGHGFSVKYAEELKAHPEYRMMVNGQRAAYREGVKFCMSNQAVVDLMIKDRMEELDKLVEQYPDSPQMHRVAFDTADGPRHCECPECMAIGSGSVSDRVFSVINQIAKAAAKAHPTGRVKVLAYNAHLAVPTFELEPNIDVWAVPYAFNTTGLSATEILEAWAQKLGSDQGRLRIRSYWSITDWSRNKPDFDYLNMPAQQMRYWYDQGVRAVSMETTYSGSMALGLYIASRLKWDINADVTAITNEFYDDCFGPARKPMQRMMERWAKNFRLIPHELALSFRDLEEALELSKDDPAVRQRVEDYVGYVQYLRKFQEYVASGEDLELTEAQRIQKILDVIEHMWRIYPSGMVQTYRLTRKFVPREPRGLLSRYTRRQAGDEQEVWDRLSKHPDSAELAQWVRHGVQDYQPMDIDMSGFDGKLVPLNTSIRPTGEFSYQSAYLRSTNHIVAYAFEDVKSISLQIYSGLGDESLVITGPDDQVMREDTIAGAGDQTYTFPTPTRGLYRIQIKGEGARKIRFPEGVPMILTSFHSLGRSGNVYFYVPKGFSQIALHMITAGTRPRFYDGSGNQIEYDGRPSRQFMLDVPPGQDGKVWHFNNFKGKDVLTPINLPHAFSLFPDTMLVPQDALER